MTKRKQKMEEKDISQSSEEIMEETLLDIANELKAGSEENSEESCEISEELEDMEADEENEKDDSAKETVSPDKKADEKAEVEEDTAKSVKDVSEKPEEDDLSAEDGEEIESELSAEDGEELEMSLDTEDGEELEPSLDAEDGEELEPSLDAEDGEELEEDEELPDEEKLAKKKKRRKVLGIIGGSVLGVVLAVYLGFAIFFSSHFYFHTTINGVDYSLQTVAKVEDTMTKEVGDYKLTLKESDGDVDVIDGKEIDLSYKKGEELNTLLKNQNVFLWPRSLWESFDIQAPVGVNYDETKLDNLLNALDCMQEENQVAPASAVPEFNGQKFVVKAEEIGSLLDVDAFKAKVAEYIAGFQSTLDMVVEDCYVKAAYFSDSPEVLAACKTMNEYLGASVTYTFGENTEVVDASVISQWLTTDENMNVTYNEEGVSQYVAGLAEKYDTYRKQRTFTSGSGNTVNVEGGDYGWKIDQAAEIAALETNISNKEVVTKEPVYKQTAASHGAADWGDTYVEVDLTNQYMYLFVNGSVVTSSPIVTGKPSEGSATPQGVYSIRYCKRNAVLRGPKKADGNYEWESPVAFWMPFNGGIGLHDATWQSAFGGNRYLTHGSHGCVNLPYNIAETVFNNVSAGTPVVCHY